MANCNMKSPCAKRLRKKRLRVRFTKVESITKHVSLVAYKAQVKKGNKKWEIQVGPAGKTLAHPE